MGVTFVTGTIVVSNYVGIALMWIPVVVGQMTCSLLLDVNVAKLPLTWSKVLAIVLVIIGALLAVFERIDSSTSNTETFVGNLCQSSEKRADCFSSEYVFLYLFIEFCTH